MKQFIIIAHDATDEGAYERRLKARDAHVQGINKLRASGNIAIGVAMLDDNEKMCGSVMVVNFPSRSDLDTWMKIEPYVTGNVWGEVKIHKGALGPSFADLLKKAS
jgi:uncharacterized protein YciI